MEEIRSVAGPIVQRYNDKIEAERQALLKKQEEELAARRAEEEAKRKAEEDAKKKDEPPKDEEMKDVETVQPDSVDEPADGKA